MSVHKRLLLLKVSIPVIGSDLFAVVFECAFLFNFSLFQAKASEGNFNTAKCIV